MRAMTTLTAIAAAALLAGCGGSGSSALPQGADAVELDAADFTSEIDNPWMPLRAGSRWVYRETDGEGAVRRVEVTVLDETREVLGIEVRIVHDLVTEDGEPVEDTYDWYAQDSDGNVWYFGEGTRSSKTERCRRRPGRGRQEWAARSRGS